MARKNLDFASLEKWFEKNKRDFPWRQDPHPYKIWIAEIMSQQTVMSALLPFYYRFMEAFPSVDALAKAPLEDVLKNWAGLGYYSRARNIHKAAISIFENGDFPKNYEGWLELSGVGPYTAAAVVSQAFQEKEAVWDGNVNRVMSRLWAEENPYEASFKNEAHSFLNAELKKTKVKASVVNQGLMELGALVCTPQNPKCDRCPLVKNCQAYSFKKQHLIPKPKPRKEFIKIKPKYFLFITKESIQKLYLEERANKNWFSGLWDFPSELGGVKSPVQALKPEIQWQSAEKLKSVKHTITHHKIEMTPYLIHCKNKKDLEKLYSSTKRGGWYTVDELVSGSIPLSTTAKKILRELTVHRK